MANGIDGFGKRLAKMRKQRSLTQNELAEKLSITPQAISKWERGEGLPDVTLFPAIAEALDVSVGALFGEEETDNVAADTFGTLSFVARYGNLCCYSDKPVLSIKDARVDFTDGSYALLTENCVVNCGPGEIRIIEQEKKQPHKYNEHEENELEKEFTPFNSIAVTNNYPCNIEILPSEDGSYRMHAIGSTRFISLIETSFTNENTLRVNVKSFNGNNSDRTENRLTIYTGFEKGESLSAHINGSGAVSTGFTFEKGTFQINGSGDIRCGDLGQHLSVQINGSGAVSTGDVQTHTVLQINGSGDITCGNFGEMMSVQINGSGDVSGGCAGTADVRIAGSGDISIDELRSALTASITGSGNISCSGEVLTLELNISGSGELDAPSLSVRDADITLKGTSGATIGRITGKSVERVAKTATLKVFNRG